MNGGPFQEALFSKMNGCTCSLLRRQHGSPLDDASFLCCEQILKRGMQKQRRLDKVSRKHYDGSSLGSVISQVTAMSYNSPDMWKLPPSEKTKLYGTDGCSVCGRPMPKCRTKARRLQRPRNLFPGIRRIRTCWTSSCTASNHR